MTNDLETVEAHLKWDRYLAERKYAFNGVDEKGRSHQNPYEQLVDFAEEIGLRRSDVQALLSEEAEQGLKNRDDEYFEDFEYIMGDLIHRKVKDLP